MSRAPCSPSTEPPAPKGRKLRLRTSTELNAKGAPPASTAGSAPFCVCRGSCVPAFQLRTEHGSPQNPLAETTSHSVHYGTQFPEGQLSHAILIKTRPYCAPKITSSHAGTNASCGATARRHAICCTVKSTSGTFILYLTNKVKEGRTSCQDGKHRSRSCSPCSRLHLP